MLRTDTEPRRFDVTLRLAASSRTETLLAVAPEWGGVTDFHRALRDLAAPDATVEPLQAGRWKVRHDAGKPVELHYNALNDVRAPDGPGELVPRDFYRTIIGSTFFHVFGHGLLIQPESANEGKPVDTCIAFEGLPRDATFASSFSAGQRDGRAQFRGPISPSALAASHFVAGDFRLLRRDIRERPVLIAVRGSWSFTDAQFADASAALIAAHREFWGDYDFPRYLLTLIPNRKPQGNTGGTAVKDAFAMHASNDFAVPGPTFDYLLAHEHLHTWVPRRIGALVKDKSAAGEEPRGYWFSEGFTNYLSHRLLVRAGFWTLDDYGRSLNGVLLDYANSPAASADNDRVAREFWSDQDVHRIPYLRGELVALHWARRLEVRDTSLETVLRALRLSRKEANDKELAVDRLRGALDARLEGGVGDDLGTYVERGTPVPVDPGFLGPCFIGKAERKPHFELGFRRPESRGWTVTGVVPGSAAEKAGLRDGMKLEGYSIRFGDTTREATIKVREGDAVRTIAYVPVAAEPMEVMVFAVKPGAGSDPACRSWMED